MSFGLMKPSFRMKAKSRVRTTRLPLPVKLRSGKSIRTLEEAALYIGRSAVLFPEPLAVEFCSSLIDLARNTRSRQDIYWAYIPIRHLLAGAGLIGH